MRLYEHPVSGNSHKIRLLMSFLGLEYESVLVDLLSDEQHKEPFLSINPRGEVPVLEDSGLILRDSTAILTYLAASHGDGRWMPLDPVGMAQVMEWLAFSSSWIQYGVFTARAITVFGLNGNGVPSDFAGNIEEATLRGKKSLEILEIQLRDQDWLCGSKPTLADIACYPYVAMAPMGNIALDPYPSVQDWIARFKTLSGYIDMPGL